MDEELRLLLEQNPWRGLAARLRQETDWTRVNMVADGDENCITAFNERLQRRGGRNAAEKEWNCRLRTECPPIPFIGNPQAGVWLLLMNPGFSPLDYYNFVDRDEGRREMSDPRWEGKAIPLELLKPDSDARFAARRELYVNSLDFSVEAGHEFYVLLNSMDTVRQTKKLHGGYNWYGSKLFKGWREEGGNVGDPSARFHAASVEERVRVASTQIFDLEYAAYHSVKFTNTNDYAQFKHTAFWEQLVAYALTHGKTLIVRGKDLLRRVEGVNPQAFQAACEAGRILRFSGQNASLSNRNLKVVHPES